MLVEENFTFKCLKFFEKELFTINSIANNSLLLSGLLIKKIRLKKMYLAFFDGNPSNLQESIIMEETLDSLKNYQKSLNFSITEIFRYSKKLIHG